MRNGIDPIRLEVLKNAFDTIADEMALILMRTAHSPIVRDSMDFSTALCDPAGETLAQGVTTPMHLGSFYDAMRFLIQNFAGQIREGDVYIANDPYAAAGQHLPDIYVATPVFDGDRIVAWSTTIAHHSDVGGIVAGAIGGSPLQVSGPAAGLTVVVAEIVNKFGWEMTCLITLGAGALHELVVVVFV